MRILFAFNPLIFLWTVRFPRFSCKPDMFLLTASMSIVFQGFDSLLPYFRFFAACIIFCLFTSFLQVDMWVHGHSCVPDWCYCSVSMPCRWCWAIYTRRRKESLCCESLSLILPHTYMHTYIHTNPLTYTHKPTYIYTNTLTYAQTHLRALFVFAAICGQSPLAYTYRNTWDMHTWTTNLN